MFCRGLTAGPVGTFIFGVVFFKGFIFDAPRAGLGSPLRSFWSGAGSFDRYWLLIVRLHDSLIFVEAQVRFAT